MKMQIIENKNIPLKKCFTSLWLSSVHLSSTAAVFQMKLLCFPPFVLSTFGSSYCKLFSALFLIHFRWKHRMKKNLWKTNRNKLEKDFDLQERVRFFWNFLGILWEFQIAYWHKIVNVTWNDGNFDWRRDRTGQGQQIKSLEALLWITQNSTWIFSENE